MEILNLASPEKSDIKYQHIKFPDGQQQITIKKESLKERECCLIKTRLNNFSDLEILICAVKSLRELKVKTIDLFVPYFLGSRSDRKFEEGSNNYLKEIICPIVNDLCFQNVTVIDPHSDVLEACLHNFNKLNNHLLIEFFLSDTNMNLDELVLLSPDAGATKKIYKTAERIGYKGEVLTCSKDRGVDGKINKTLVPLEAYHYGQKKIVIIDDICDGGATFINIAKEIKNLYKNDIYLVITHGIFSKDFDELSKYFTAIYCTNSYKEISDTGHHCIIKQKNIF